eukprot:TRINITY_DN107486_c0_g1_i1.p1 TRINITY_DN107486_c0_g1~~TRINITY_DN107486_c0_g1_i1.p1  ORF type:complete len:629 (-),score=101.99 TRINITY_DN107486_c0_g1_i1:143-2029(-)
MPLLALAMLPKWFAKFAGIEEGEKSPGDCGVWQPRRALPSAAFEPRIVPAPDDKGFAIAWQDGDSLLLRRFDRRCSGGEVLEVNSTRDFWRQPGASGLQDAAGLPGGKTVVAWTANRDIWIRTMDASSTSASPTKASGSREHDRTEVHVATSSSSGHFALIWQSWGQDGDGWGVFARAFSPDGTPFSDEEVQVNVGGGGFQWHPKLTWCGDSLWALWVNGTGDLDADRHFEGPVVRRLVADGKWAPAEEVHLKGGMPLTTALSCADGSFLGKGESRGDTVVALWLERGGHEVRWEYIRSSGGFQIQILSHLFMRRRLQLADESLRSPPLLDAQQADDRSHSEQVGWLQQLEEASKLALDPGQVQMLAHGNLMMLLTRHRSGILGAQLVQYISARPITFSRRMLASSSLSGSATWDAYTDDLAVLSCWATGGAFEAHDPSAFECARHPAGWLADGDLNGPVLAARSLCAAFAIAVVCWFVVRATHHVFMLGRFASGRSGRRGQRSSRSRRLREVRRQLSQIPDSETPRQSDSVNDEEPASDGREQLMANADDSEIDVSEDDQEAPQETCRYECHERDCCPICHEPVGVWVALRPCGHTACRYCTLKLAETSLKCHMCRSSIKGVQPVYI